MSILLFPTLPRNRKTINTQIIANTRNNQVRPLAIHDGGKDKVSAEIPQLEPSRDGPEERRSGDGKVRVIDNQGTTNHRREHNRPIGKRLVRKMGEDNLRRHPAKDERHGQAVQDEVIVLEQT
jgi:hypothetical protein